MPAKLRHLTAGESFPIPSNVFSLHPAAANTPPTEQTSDKTNTDLVIISLCQLAILKEIILVKRKVQLESGLVVEVRKADIL